MPVDCSELALAISAMTDATPLMELDDLVQRDAGIVDPVDAFLHLPVRTGDQILDVFGRLRRALREAAHFGRHHRKAAAGFAGARSFHRGVECQQIGLPSDLVDHADDVGYLV